LLGDPRSSETYYPTMGTGLKSVFGFHVFNEITKTTHTHTKQHKNCTNDNEHEMWKLAKNKRQKT
jgi:hypothetical protein